MVKEKTINGEKYYQCEICKFYYKTKDLAQKCEDFCKKHNACSIEITRHSVQIDKKSINANDE
jgi:hypothetical protein